MKKEKVGWKVLLEELNPDTTGYSTAMEIAKERGISVSTARGILNKLVKEGKLDRIRTRGKSGNLCYYYKD